MDNESNDKRIINYLDFSKYIESAPNINKAVTSIIENSVSIFLPYKRIDKTKVYKKFIDNDQTLEVKNDFLEKVKVEVKGRLLGQIHKDILEAILSSRKTFDPDESYFKVKTTAYKLLQKMHCQTNLKQWLLKQIEHISQSRIKIYYGNKETFDFNFISSIKTIEDGKKILINFTREYTYFLAANELINYSNYINDIMGLKGEIKLIENEIRKKKKIKFKNGINTEFIKAIVRYMLTHNGKHSNIGIAKLLDKSNIKNIMTQKEINESLIDLRRPEIQNLLKEKFGIQLTNNQNTLSYNAPINKSRNYFQPTFNPQKK